MVHHVPWNPPRTVPFVPDCAQFVPTFGPLGDPPSVMLSAMGAGASAQAEYERRRGRDRERRRRRWKRSLAWVVLTPFVVYGSIRLMVWGLSEWGIPWFTAHIQKSVGGEQSTAPTTDAAGSIPPLLAHRLGLGFAAIATIREMVTVWGPKRTTEAWAKGAKGERATGTALDTLPKGFVALHDLKMPGSRGNIDHLVIGPTGAFTVETKNYANTVVLKRGRAYSAGRSLDGVVAQATRQASAMTNVLDVEVRPIVCVWGAGVERSGWFQGSLIGGVRFCSGRRLNKVLTQGDKVLTAAEVAALAGHRLDAKASTKAVRTKRAVAKRPTDQPAAANAASPTGRAAGRTARPPAAPAEPGGRRPCACGADLVLRYRRSDKQPFWGCSTFPACRQTQQA